MTDLHLHSTASDGYLTPTELMQYVKDHDVTLCSLTDHDTIDGVEEALQAAREIGIQCIRGIELSCLVEQNSVHLLGYFNRPASPLLIEKLTEIQKWRAERNPKIVEKLQKLGCAITMNDVVAEANGGQVGRPHIARALIKNKVVKSTDEAFTKYLANGKPAYVEKDRLGLTDAVRLVHESGGIAILAHPLVYNFMKPELLEPIVRKAISAGIDGIEAHYTEHKKSDRRRIERMTENAGLLVTGGSDFHGPKNGHIQPGRGYGDLDMPDKFVNEFLKRVSQLPAD